MDFDTWLKRLHKTTSKKLISLQDELLLMYEIMLVENGIRRFDVDSINTKRAYSIGKFVLPADTKYLKFTIATTSYSAFEASIAVTSSNQIYFIYRGRFKRGIRRVFSATTIVRCIKVLKRNGTLISK